MIVLNRRTKVFLHKAPTNMTLSYDGLFQKVKRVLKKDPFSGHLFLFVNRRHTTCKALYYDGTGLVVVGKRMEQNRLFSRVNPLYKKQLVLTQSEFGLFFEGANLEKRFVDTAVEIKKKRTKSLPFLKSYSKVNSNGIATRPSKDTTTATTHLR